MHFASLLHPAKHIQDDADPCQQSTPFPKIARVAICTLLAASLTAAGAPSALAQDDATQQAASKSEGAAESHGSQSQQMSASEPEPEPAQPVEPENEPAAPAGDAAPGALDGDTGTDAIVGEGASSAATENSPATNDGAEGSTASGIPADSHTPPLDANAEPLSEEEVEDGETEAEEPETQAETRAGDPVRVETQEDLQDALDRKDPLIEVVQTIGDGFLSDNDWKEFRIDYAVEITSNATGENREIWYSWFTVESGGSLTLSGNLFVNGNIQGSTHHPLDCITVEAGGSLSVRDHAQILSDGGIALDGHQKPEGIAVVIEGGTTTISTSSRIEGSSGGLLITEEGGTCTITSGTFATESSVTAESWIDSGHTAVDNINGTLILHGDGSSIRIDSLENSGTLYAQGTAFEEVPFHNGTTTDNPIFNNQDTTGGESTSGGVAHTGRAWLYDCSFTKPNDGSKGIYAEGPTYVYAPASGENHALKVNGTYYYSEAPEIAWNGGEYTFKVANSASGPAANVRRCYLGSNLPVSSFDAFRDAIGGDLNNNVIADTTSFSSSISVDPSINNAANMPYALAAFDYPVDGDDVFHVFGPTSELNLMSVDVQWGNMAFTISPSPASDNWNPSSHTYGVMDIDFNSRQKDAPWSNQVWVTKNSSVRPITATAAFTPEEKFRDVFEGSYKYTYPGDSTENYEGIPLTLDDRRLTFQLNLSFKSDPLIYSLDHDKIGTATVTIGYAS